MPARLSHADRKLAAIDELLAGLAASEQITRFRAMLAAVRFHLREGDGDHPMILAILGGTGTGKSTLLNRLLGANVSAASVRRTFTAGPIAVLDKGENVPEGFLAIPHRVASELRTRGTPDELSVVDKHPAELTRRLTLLDTPDLDGDQPAHHAQADRAFRWAQAALFVVTPEKYQMTELLPYYRLASRYGLPALFVMNKSEHAEAVEDYARQLAGHGFASATVFAVARDDSHFQAPHGRDLEALRSTASSLPRLSAPAREEGLRQRLADLVDRLHDQVLQPLESDWREAQRLIEALRSLEAPAAGVDVNPVTRQLARRLQQRSILYLMGPQRILDRVRQVPGLLVRLPRTAWDLVMSGKADLSALNPENWDERKVPDFRAMLVDQFSVLQTRIEDVLRSSSAGAQWLQKDAPGYAAARIDPARAGAAADEELADLNTWLEKRWNATPRDTAILMKVLHHLPGGDRLTRWSEAAPYLLTIIVATHHVAFGHVDLMILGAYSVATWLTERISNEVAGRTRLTNRRIAERFERLVHEQIEATVKWLESRAPSAEVLKKLRIEADSLGE